MRHAYSLCIGFLLVAILCSCKGQDSSSNQAKSAIGVGNVESPPLGQQAVETQPQSPAPSGKAQQGSKEEGIRLMSEASRLHGHPRSNEDIRTAVTNYKKALEILEKLDHQPGILTISQNLCGAYLSWGQADNAMTYCQRALSVSRELADLKAECYALTSVGAAFLTKGQYSKAEELFKQALALGSPGEAGPCLVDGLDGLVEIFSARGKYSEALSYALQALELAHSTGDIGECYFLTSVACRYQDLGDYGRADQYFQKALALAERSRDSRAKASVLGATAYNHAFQGNPETAVKVIQESVSLWKNFGLSVGDANLAIGGLYLDMGQVSEAEAAIRENSLFCLKHSSTAREYFSSLGRLYITKSDFETARYYYIRLLARGYSNGHADSMFIACTGLGMALEGIADDSQAAEYYEQAVRLSEELRSALTRAEREKFFEAKRGGFFRVAPYQGLARMLMKLGKPCEALKATEYTKARGFAEHLSRLIEIRNAMVPAEILKDDEELNDSLAALKKRKNQAKDKEYQAAVMALEPQIAGLETMLAGHIKMLREKYPLFAATKYPQPMGLDETALRADEWVLAYDVTDSGLLIYLTKGKKMIRGLFSPIPKKDVDALVEKFLKPMELASGVELASTLEAFDFDTAKKLSDILLGDVLPDLPRSASVIIVPDDCLARLPFEMLVLKNGGKVQRDRDKPFPHVYVTGAEFFGDRNLISYQQSITALTLARTYGEGKKPGDKLQVIADPIFDCNDGRAKEACAREGEVKVSKVQQELYSDAVTYLGTGTRRLEATGKLAENLKRMFPGMTEVAAGQDATKERFLSDIAPNLQSFGKLVFATHGELGKKIPGIMEPVLVLTLVPPGTDGYLRLSEVMGLKMNADIVALTACQTGRGERRLGEGVLSMGRAFQYAGARSVLMSLWYVAEQSSVNMVESFFRHRKENKSKLEALKLARDEIRKAGYDHPFFWASFILVGEPN